MKAMTDKKIDLRLLPISEARRLLATMDFSKLFTATMKAAADYETFLVEMQVMYCVPQKTTGDFVGRLLRCGYNIDGAKQFIRHQLAMGEDVILLSARINIQERHWHHASHR